MARLELSFALTPIEELLEGRLSPDRYWRDVSSSITYYFQRLSARTDELVEKFGDQRIEGSLTISDFLKVGTQTKLTAMRSVSVLVSGWPQIPAQGQGEVVVPVSGVVVGDSVTASPEGGLENGLMWNAYIPSNGNVAIRVVNVTNAPITPANRNWRLVVMSWA